MLNHAKETFQTVYNSYFKRYDLSKEWAQLSKISDDFKKKLGREPFMYDLIGELLGDLDELLKKKILDLLYQKDNTWFNNTGQYLFYNLSQWMHYFKTTNKISLNNFLCLWWSRFLEFESDAEKLIKNFPFPRKVLLELTNNCNLNCIMCGIGKNRYDPNKNMSLDLLQSLSEEVLPQTKLIRLNGLGESTILPNFIEYLNIISDSPAQLEIVTNLTVANVNIWDKLLENSTNFLISCDSATPKVYESIRRGASYFGFKNNLRYIGANISNPLQGQIIFTLMECNINEIINMVELAAEMGLGGIIVNVVKLDTAQCRWMEQKADQIVELFQKAHDLATSYNISLKLPDHLGEIPVNKKIANISCHRHCNNPWEEVYIRYNGDLTVCNMLNPYIYGNCQYKNFAELWNGINVQLFRSFVNTEYRHYYCRECYYLI